MASLHQAIADILPTRLEFYENWLNSSGLREGTIGVAQFFAVLSFLRQEGPAYGLIMARAGEYAAVWTTEALPEFERSLILALPRALRLRAALWLARRLVRQAYSQSRALTRTRRGAGSVDVRGSLFCTVRENTTEPLCGFYAAAVSRFLSLLKVAAEAHVTDCRATGAANCLVSVTAAGSHRSAVAA